MSKGVEECRRVLESVKGDSQVGEGLRTIWRVMAMVVTLGEKIN